MTRARILADYVSSGDELADKLDLSGGAMTGAITTNSTFDGIDVGTAVAANTAKVTNYNQTVSDINALDVTELGTVTSANLANTDIVYPAGHVIGVQHIVDTSANTTSSTTYAVACSSVAYTIKNASSTLWITGHFNLNFLNSNAKIKSVWSINDFTNITTISESDAWGIRNNNTGLINFLVPFSEKYTHGLAVGATIRFRMYANRQGGSGTTSLNEHDSARMTILEVM